MSMSIAESIEIVGNKYMSMQANGEAIPAFKAELGSLLISSGLPKEFIDGILLQLDGFAREPNTSCTTFPYMAKIVTKKILEYAQNNAATQVH